MSSKSVRPKVTAGEVLQSQPIRLKLEPFGVTLGLGDQRPIMLFRVEGTEQVMPVWLSPIEAGIAISQNQARGSGESPHDLSLKVLLDLGLRVETCTFEEVRGHHQYVRVDLRPERLRGRVRSVTCRAEQAISFCLHAGAQFYTRPECVPQSQIMNLEMLGSDVKLVEQGLRTMKGRPKYLN